MLAWTEWEYFRTTGDRERLNRVLPVLIAYHRWLRAYRTWPDACLQQLLSAKLLSAMAETLGRTDEARDLAAEAARLSRYVNDKLWDDAAAYYFDLKPDGEFGTVKSIGAYWALIADAVPPEGMERFVAHLSDPREFKRPHPIPSLRSLFVMWRTWRTSSGERARSRRITRPRRSPRASRRSRTSSVGAVLRRSPFCSNTCSAFAPMPPPGGSSGT